MAMAVYSSCKLFHWGKENKKDFSSNAGEEQVVKGGYSSPSCT